MSGVEIWDHINATLTAVKWPMVVVLAGWFLRRELAGLVRRLWKIEAGGARVEFDAKQEALMLGVEIGESGERVIEAAAGSSNGAGKPFPEEPQSLVKLRAEIESLIEASFQTGFLAGTDRQPGVQKLPAPTVQWNGSEPRITGWTSDNGSVALRMVLGSRLRSLREAAGISRSDAGWAIRASESKLSRLELGRLPTIKERDLNDLLTLYGVTDEQERDDLLQTARSASEPTNGVGG